MLVGGLEYDDSIAGTYQGSAHLFTRVAGVWTEASVLVASTPRGFDYYGRSVAVDGDVLAVGVPSYGSPAAPS